MLSIFKKEKVTLFLPYKVKIMADLKNVVLEAQGMYNEEFLCFHVMLDCINEDLARQIYVTLNENILKQIHVIVEKNYVENFKFDFKDIIDEELLKDVHFYDKKIIKEGTI